VTGKLQTVPAMFDTETFAAPTRVPRSIHTSTAKPPKWSDIVAVPPGAELWPTHLKKTSTFIDMDVIDSMARAPGGDANVLAFWMCGKRWLTEEAYDVVRDLPAAVRLKDKRPTTMTRRQVLDFFHSGSTCRVNEPDIMAYCRSFTVPEIAKMRWRGIAWVEVVNSALPRSVLQPIDLATVPQVKDVVGSGLYQVQYDVSSCFYLMEQPKANQLLQCFMAINPDDGSEEFYSWVSTVMGSRVAVEASQAFLKVLADVGADEVAPAATAALAAKTTRQCYVDNFKATGSYEQCVAARDIFYDRAQRAGVLLNNPQRPEPTQREDFLGIDCDHAANAAAAGAKVVAKAALLWSRRSEWTRYNYSVFVGVCHFISRVIDFDFSVVFFLMRWTATTLAIDERDERWHRPLVVPPSLQRQLTHWATQCITNEPIRPRSKNVPYVHVVIVDSSKWGVGFVAINLRNNTMRVGQRAWKPDEYVHSTSGETLGAYVAAKVLFPPQCDDRVHLLMDATSAIASLNRGYSKRARLNETCMRMKRDLPGIVLSAEHVAGNIIAADALSRGIPVNEVLRSDEFQIKLKLCLGGVDGEADLQSRLCVAIGVVPVQI
jgi:hypothetical protein